LICNCHFRKNLTEDWLWSIVPGSPQKKTLRTGPNNLLWHYEFCSGYFLKPPGSFRLFVFWRKNLELEVIKTSPTLVILSIFFHFLSYSCVLYSPCNESLAGYYYYLRPFLLFLFFHKVKEFGGTPNRVFFFFFFQFSDMEKLENFSKNLAKFIKFYVRKPEISPLLFCWINEKKLKKKVDSEYLRDKLFFPILWGIKKFANNNAKHTENYCQN
jgi:hypothetical protein